MFLKKMFDFKNIIDNELYKKEFMEFSKRDSITRIEFENIFESAKIENEKEYYEEIIPIPGFNISIFEEGSTVTTNSDLKPIFDFVMPNSLGTILQSQISQINNIYKVLYNDILPNITEI
jgi:predicted mannosyl-3-phosphoglycerate phosphatase (HAD superfamily)